MPKRSSKKKPDESQQPDAEQAATPGNRETGGKNPAAVALGRLGGAKGGKARAAKLTKERRAEIARKAAQARWKKKEV